MGLFNWVKNKSKAVKATVSISTHEYTSQELQEQQGDGVSIIKALAKNSFPSKNGLRPHEIAMLSVASRYTTSEHDFPRYWYFNYGIDNAIVI